MMDLLTTGFLVAVAIGGFYAGWWGSELVWQWRLKRKK